MNKLSFTLMNFINKRFSINKRESFCNLNAIAIPPSCRRKKIDKARVKREIRGKELADFYRVLTNKLKYYDFSYMHENIRSLKIQRMHLKSPKLIKRKVAAYYNCRKNIIKYTPKMKDIVLPHELLHMASTTKKSDNKSIFSGFSQSTNLSNYELIACGLNEGYTQLLAERYFNIVYKVYPIEKLIARKLEEIIGKEEMEKMYFSADLKSLVNIMSEYLDGKSIIMFLYCIDFLGVLYSKSNLEKNFPLFKKAYYNIAESLINIKTAQLIREDISMREKQEKLIKFARELRYEIVNSEEFEKYTLISNEAIDEIIKKNINKLNNEYLMNKISNKTYLK